MGGEKGGWVGMGGGGQEEEEWRTNVAETSYKVNTRAIQKRSREHHSPPSLPSPSPGHLNVRSRPSPWPPSEKKQSSLATLLFVHARLALLISMLAACTWPEGLARFVLPLENDLKANEAGWQSLWVLVAAARE